MTCPPRFSNGKMNLQRENNSGTNCDEMECAGNDSNIDDEFDQDKKGRNMISLTELLVVALKFLTF